MDEFEEAASSFAHDVLLVGLFGHLILIAGVCSRGASWPPIPSAPTLPLLAHPSFLTFRMVLPIDVGFANRLCQPSFGDLPLPLPLLTIPDYWHSVFPFLPL